MFQSLHPSVDFPVAESETKGRLSAADHVYRVPMDEEIPCLRHVTLPPNLIVSFVVVEVVYHNLPDTRLGVFNTPPP